MLLSTDAYHQPIAVPLPSTDERFSGSNGLPASLKVRFAPLIESANAIALRWPVR